MFTPPEEQVKRLLEINATLWRKKAITAEAIAALGDPPECPPSDEQHLYCVVLLYETGNALRTLKQNWTACVHVFGMEWTRLSDNSIVESRGVRQWENALPRKPGLRWALAELGRTYRGCRCFSSTPYTDGFMGVGQELPLIAAMHPRWATSINGETIPAAFAPDLLVGDSDDFGIYLSFNRDSGEVYLDATNPCESPFGGGPRLGFGFLQ